MFSSSIFLFFQQEYENYYYADSTTEAHFLPESEKAERF